MTSLPRQILIDTNLWLDEYIGIRPNGETSRQLFDFCFEKEISLLYALPSIKDVYYLIISNLKAQARNQGESITEENALAIEQYSWKCVENMMTLATAVPLDASDLMESRRLHQVHRDLEDNLVIAAALRANADYLVTNDMKIIKHALVPSLSPADMLHLLQSYQ